MFIVCLKLQKPQTFCPLKFTPYTEYDCHLVCMLFSCLFGTFLWNCERHRTSEVSVQYTTVAMHNMLYSNDFVVSYSCMLCGVFM